MRKPVWLRRRWWRRYFGRRLYEKRKIRGLRQIRTAQDEVLVIARPPGRKPVRTIVELMPPRWEPETN